MFVMFGMYDYMCVIWATGVGHTAECSTLPLVRV